MKDKTDIFINIVLIILLILACCVAYRDGYKLGYIARDKEIEDAIVRHWVEEYHKTGGDRYEQGRKADNRDYADQHAEIAD